MKSMAVILLFMFIFCIAYAEEVIIDNTAPVITMGTPLTSSPAYNRSGQSVRIEFNYSEANPQNYTISIYNTTTTICSKTVTNLVSGNVSINDSCVLPAVNDGSFNLTINLTDAVGNTSSATQLESVIVDTVTPSITSSEPTNNSEIITSSILLAVNTSEIAECRYSQFPLIAFNSMTVFPNTNSTHHSIVLATDDSGTYDFYIKCKDSSNNIMANDYYITFNVTANFVVTGRTAYMNLAFHIGNSKSDDIYRASRSYFASYDSSGVVIGVASSGTPIGVAVNKTYNTSDIKADIYQSLDNNRFLITATRGDSGTISSKISQLGSGKILSKTFGSFETSPPSSFPVAIDVDYDDIDITSHAGWSGTGGIIIKNNGKTSQGLTNITIEVTK